MPLLDPAPSAHESADIRDADTSASSPISDAQTQTGAKPEQHDVSVRDMVGDLSVALDSAIGEIHSVNAETKILALNARIEAARAGRHGAAFGVVAEEMQNLSDKTYNIANDMANRTRDRTSELMGLIDSTIRGTRLSDLALVNIDLIDRNLYERTCDVRWWATDGSLVDVLTSATKEATEFASKRLGVILDAYTVYHDLVLCDRSGEIVANGRPLLFSSVGREQSTSDWFSQAMGTRTGDEYGFQSAHNSRLVNDRPTLIYSCSVRENGESNGRILGALGILFDWDGLANPILENIPVSPSEKENTDAYIVNSQGQILASNKPISIGSDLNLPEFKKVLQNPTGFYVTKSGDQQICVGHAKAPGFETYSTGWYSIIVQPLES